MGAWGAVVSTSVAILHLFKAISEKPRISVEAVILSKSASEGQDTYGFLIQTKRGHDIRWEEIVIELTIRNSGYRACQITDIFVEEEKSISQIRPKPLPWVLDPITSVSVLVQPEWFVPSSPANESGGESGQKDDIVLVAGVFDALGKKHKIQRDNLRELIKKLRDLPVRKKLFRQEKTGALITAFQSKDYGRIINK